MSFIQLNREPGIHYLVRHETFQTSPAFEHLLEANCRIRTLSALGENESSLSVPLSDFANYPVGSLFGRSKATTQRNRDRQRSRRIVQLGDSFEPWQFKKNVLIKSKKLVKPYDLIIDQKEKAFINEADPDMPLGFAQGEQFRFICSGLSFLLDSLSLRSTMAQGSLASMFVDEAETGINESGTYVITPLRPFQNATATLQIVLLLTNPELANYVQSFFRWVGLALQGRVGPSSSALTFKHAMDCTIESERVAVTRTSGERSVVEFCDRIIADHRKPAFKDIVVRIRNREAGEKVEMIQKLRTEAEKQKLRISSSTKVKRYPSSDRIVRLGRMEGDFGRLFPEFAKLNLRFDRQKVTTEGQPASPGRGQGPAKKINYVSPVASVGDLKNRKSKIPKLLTGSVETVVFERPSIAAKFVAHSDEPGLTTWTARLDQLSPVMREFMLAGYNMIDRLCPHSLPEYNLSRGEEVLYKLPSEWGGFARPDAQGRMRSAAAFPLAFDNGIVWAIEFLRNDDREQIAMGLVAQLEPDDGLSFLGRVLRSVCDRVGRKRAGGDAPGTFPRADFLDTRIDTIAHKETHWDGETLSQLIPARAQLLLSPDRNF